MGNGKEMSLDVCACDPIRSTLSIYYEISDTTHLNDSKAVYNVPVEQDHCSIKTLAD